MLLLALFADAVDPAVQQGMGYVIATIVGAAISKAFDYLNNRDKLRYDSDLATLKAQNATQAAQIAECDAKHKECEAKHQTTQTEIQTIKATLAEMKAPQK